MNDACVAEKTRYVTYFAIDPHDPDGKEVTLGRGNPDDPGSLASDAFAAIDTTDPRLHAGIVANIRIAARQRDITVATGALILAEAATLAEQFNARVAAKRQSQI